MKFYKRNIKIVRPFNAFGPWQSMKAVIPELIIKSLRGEEIKTTKGLQTREFNYVQNLVDGFISCAKNKKTLQNVYNIGSNKEIRIKDIARLIHKLTNSKSKLSIGKLKSRKTDILRMSANYKKFSAVTNWKPNKNFIDGMKITIEWYRKYLKNFENSKSDLYKLF